MAKVTLVFEDCDDGVAVSMTSDPPLPHREDFSSQDPDLSDAQHMALGVVHHMEKTAQGESESTEQHQCQRNEKPEAKCCRKKEEQTENCCQH